MHIFIISSLWHISTDAIQIFPYICCHTRCHPYLPFLLSKIYASPIITNMFLLFHPHPHSFSFSRTYASIVIVAINPCRVSDVIISIALHLCCHHLCHTSSLFLISSFVPVSTTIFIWYSCRQFLYWYFWHNNLFPIMSASSHASSYIFYTIPNICHHFTHRPSSPFPPSTAVPIIPCQFCFHHRFPTYIM